VTSAGRPPTEKRWSGEPRRLLAQLHIPEVLPGHIKWAVDVFPHDPQPEHIAIENIGHALPEEPVEVLPEAIAPLVLQLRLHGLQQLGKVGVTVPPWRVAAQALHEGRIGRGTWGECIRIPQVGVACALPKRAPIYY